VREGADGTLAPLMSAFQPPDPPVPVPAAEPDDQPDEDLLGRPDDEPVEEILAQYPPVVAVVVTRNPGPWL